MAINWSISFQITQEICCSHLRVRNQTSQRNNRTNSDPDFVRFNAIFHNSHPICTWNNANYLREIQNLKFTCKLIASKTLETPILFILLLVLSAKDYAINKFSKRIFLLTCTQNVCSFFRFFFTSLLLSSLPLFV